MGAKASAVGLRALKRAHVFVGFKEHPAGSNHGPYDKNLKGGIDDWCYRANGIKGGYPWCSAFTCAMFEDAGRKITAPLKASVGYLEKWAGEHGYLVKRPFAGDIVCYRFDSDNWPDHVGIVDKVLAVKWFGGKFVGTIRTVEGNTSAGNDANGGQVQIRYRSAARCTFIRIPDK
jgi:hypothetical protein